jgi:hypothetical protein
MHSVKINCTPGHGGCKREVAKSDLAGSAAHRQEERYALFSRFPTFPTVRTKISSHRLARVVQRRWSIRGALFGIPCTNLRTVPGEEIERGEGEGAGDGDFPSPALAPEGAEVSLCRCRLPLSHRSQHVKRCRRQPSAGRGLERKIGSFFFLRAHRANGVIDFPKSHVRRSPTTPPFRMISSNFSSRLKNVDAKGIK